ncbi:MAG: zinc-binding dehydrogenase [Acidimicrobiia bacterium]|nr:zinc-binding dehydrogenase [Acidimicrobiia bacterium]
MRAARIENGTLGITDVEVPVPAEDHALVRITAAGVCHSDLHLVRGDWYGVQPPEIGHEAIGVVESLGEGAERFVSVGDRVILGLGGTGGGFWCGACEYCLRGQPRHCAQSKGVMGVFAEQFSVYAPGLVQLPDSVGDEEAPLACGGLTAYGAVKKLRKHGIDPGRTVAVIGAAGGLGHYAVQLATAFGYRVVGVDIGEERLAFVRELGAEIAVGPDDAVEVVTRELGGVDASLVFSAKLAGFDLGLELLRKAGLFVAVGLPATSEGKLQLDPFQFFAKDPTLIYSAVGTVQDMRELVDLAAAGKVATHVSRTGPLSELPAIFDELEAGKYLGRAVVTDLSR